MTRGRSIDPPQRFAVLRAPAEPGLSIASWALPCACALAACGVAPLEEVAVLEEEATVCGKGPTVKGIDVSSYQGAIDWAAVRADGVEFAFIRAGDGVGYVDSLFGRNWDGAAKAGILRGAYQFFRPDEDPVAQADLLLGKLAGAPGELPPVIDVEDTGALPPDKVAAAVRAWVARVRPVIGREPIIYTGFYFWRDDVGALDMTASPLWHAQYTTATCPNIAPPWTDWAFWQYTATGRVAGITGDVDLDRWNGTREDLASFAAAEQPCGVIPPEGGEIDDSDPCFVSGGPPEFLRRVTDAGEGSGLIWTYATASAAEVSFAHWELVLAQAGRYRIEVSTPAPYAASSQARYIVTAAGVRHELMLDQSQSSGWQTLGDVDFAEGGGQSVHLGDNTGEASTRKVQLAFDAIRLTPVSDEEPSAGGCGAGGGTPTPALGALVLGLAARRRRRRDRAPT